MTARKWLSPREGISGFTFIHNAIESGYPIVEAVRAVQPYVSEVVAVDMQSTDTTREVLTALGCRVIEGKWMPGTNEACLDYNHSLNVHCRGPVVVFFEADEVYDDALMQYIHGMIQEGTQSMSVHRLQIEQNFQRIAWYPEPVHRVFVKGMAKRRGHTTEQWALSDEVQPEMGFLWDCRSTCRDNWIPRCKKQAEWWGGEPRYRIMSHHFTYQPFELTEEQAIGYLKEPHWTWTNTPLFLPKILVPLVGKVRYEANV